MPVPEEYPTLEQRSRTLFTSRYRLPVWEAVGQYDTEPAEPFIALQIISDVKRTLGKELDKRYVTKHVLTLVELGMAAKAPSPSTLEDSFIRIDAPEWPPLLELIDRWSKPPEIQLNLF